MRRRGFLLIEAVLAIFILAMVAAAVFPFAGQLSRTTDFLVRRSRASGEALFAADFMTEKLRNNLSSGAAAEESDAKGYDAYNESNVRSTYEFYVAGEKMRLRLYNGRTQPLTGNTNSAAEDIECRATAGEKIFKTYSGGLTKISFEMEHHATGDVYRCETAVMGYTDYFKVGDEW